MSTSKGFTLIELLVVIAIISILSSIILANLNSVRGKSVISVVASNLANARAQAELFYDANGGTYVVTAGTVTDVCNASGSVSGVRGVYTNVFAAAAAAGLSTVNTNFTVRGTSSTATCHSQASGWAAEVPVKNTNGEMWCVDSTGVSAKLSASTLLTNDSSCY